MKSITLNLPESIATLHPKVGDKIFLSALRESVKQFVLDEQKELKNINKRMKIFEKKYQTKFQNFQKNLPDDADFQMHEDYGEWSYLIDVAKAIEEDILNYRRLNGEVK